ncbi:MAG: DUF5063 domain-containing protein [Eubacteriales bacterium]|nr:DUF5063 domain-containing protein [Eubacteriales bacterium]
MHKDKAKEFYMLADEYCCFLEENVITADTVPHLIEMLMRLYISAMDLPETEPETNESSPGISDAVSVRLSEQIPAAYWEVFDPYVDEDPVCGDLIDDLSDIAADLTKGMREYETGRYGNAVFEWKHGFCSHWGQHVVDALRALHAVRAR